MRQIKIMKTYISKSPSERRKLAFSFLSVIRLSQKNWAVLSLWPVLKKLVDISSSPIAWHYLKAVCASFKYYSDFTIYTDSPVENFMKYYVKGFWVITCTLNPHLNGCEKFNKSLMYI